MKLAVVLLPVVLTPAILATPPAAEAQAAGKLYRVGALVGSGPSVALPNVEALREGLRGLRYTEGQNVTPELR